MRPGAPREPSETTTDEITRRYIRLSRAADDAAERLARTDTDHQDAEPRLSRLERTREQMSARVAGMQSATGAERRILQSEANQISGRFEEAIDGIRALADDIRRPQPPTRPHRR